MVIHGGDLSLLVTMGKFIYKQARNCLCGPSDGGAHTVNHNINIFVSCCNGGNSSFRAADMHPGSLSQELVNEIPGSPPAESFHSAVSDLSPVLPPPPHATIPSPLGPFSILPFFPMKIGDLYFSFINPSLFMLLTLSLVLLLLYFVTKKGGVPPFEKIWKRSQRHSPNTRS